MAQAKGNERIVTDLGVLALTKGLEYADEELSDTRKYNKINIARLNALIRKYKKVYANAPHNFDLDMATKKPIQEFTSGNWEEYCQEKVFEKEASVLRVDVDLIIKIICKFLDDRRVNVGGLKGMFYDVSKGDIEEKVFSEMIDWAVRCLDCNADENLIEVINNRIKYLESISDDQEIFPKKGRNDKSVIYDEICKICKILKNITLKVKDIQDREFLLSKFKHISTLSEVLINHFLNSFSCFSPNLRGLADLTEKSVGEVALKSGTKFDNLFLLFLQNAFIGRFRTPKELSDNILENAGLVFDPAAFETLMLDESRKLGISVPMPSNLLRMINEIFIDAYNLSISMKLISYSSNTLSQQGTDTLLCDQKGRLYFGFLISDFQFSMGSLKKKLLEFDNTSKEFSGDLYRKTSETLGDRTEAGQHKRFQKMFKIIEKDCKILEVCLKETADKIENFSSVDPEESEKNKIILYETLRARMRAKNNHQLADQLESGAEVLPIFSAKEDDPGLDEKSQDPLNGLLSQPHGEVTRGVTPSSVPKKEARKKLNGSTLDEAGDKGIQELSNGENQQDSGGASSPKLEGKGENVDSEETPLVESLPEGVELFPEDVLSLSKDILSLDKEIQEAMRRMDGCFQYTFFQRFGMSKEVESFSYDLLNILQKRDPINFCDLKAQVDAFVKRVNYADEKRPEIGYKKKLFYEIARDLMVTFCQYQHLTSHSQSETDRLKKVTVIQANKIEAGRMVARDQNEILENQIDRLKKQADLLERKEEEIVEKIHDIRELQSDNKLQADKISELIALVKSQSKEFKDMKKDIKAELKAEMLEEYHKLKLAEKQNSQNNDQSRSNGHSMG